MKIKKEMEVNQVLRDHPETINVFIKNGLRCFGCLMSESESLEEAAAAHDLDLENFLKDLNDSLKEDGKTE